MEEENKPNNFLQWLGISNNPNWSVARPLGNILGVFLIGVVPILFLTAIAAAFAVLWHTAGFTGDSSSNGVNLGAGALIAALLGAPFLIWSTVLRHQTVRYQKEGHITDRINKAVEQLGSEKSVEQIGRSVTVWTGEPTRISYPVERVASLVDQPRTKAGEKEWIEYFNDQTEEVGEGQYQTVATWPDERTIIEWLGQGVVLGGKETVGLEGPWQVFKETAKNIEVRIGAILSLERIAQDSTRYDNGRDHIRVMEILCAYIRENTETPILNVEFDEIGPFETEPDIQIALDVIKRRSREQIRLEAIQEYRLDLRACDFRGYDLGRGSFRGAIFALCRLETASLRFSDFSGSRFDGSVLNFVDFRKSNLTGADLRQCRIDKPEPQVGGFVQSINMGELKGVSLISANIPSVQYLDKETPTFGTKDTKLWWELDEEREKVANAKPSAPSTNPVQEGEGKLSTFSSWSSFDGSDMTTPQFLEEFRETLELTGWPYDP